VSRPVARYRSSRRYLLFALLAIGGTLFCIWTAIRWPATWTAAALFGATAITLMALVCRPAIEVHETHLQLGRRVIFWNEIRRVDQTGWLAPLGVRLTLADGRRILVLYAGDVDSSTSLLRHLRRYSRNALLDGIPYRQAWGDPAQPERPADIPKSDLATLPGGDRQQPSSSHRPLLRAEEEEEIERMFQRLKSVGRLDQRGSDEP
jgi:hypothetical protein